MTRHPRRSLAAITTAAIGTVATVAVAVGPRTAGASDEPVVAGVEAARYGPTITIDGRGFGHGRGMGQWGAYGYAVEQGWTYRQILDHYYGGTRAGTTDPSGTVAVRLIALDDRETVLWQPGGRLLTSAAPGQRFSALRVVESAPNRWDVFSGPNGCATANGEWQPVVTGFAPPGNGDPKGVTFDVENATDDTANVPGDLIGVCGADGSVRFYRGDLFVANDPADGSNHTVNVVAIEQYLRGNVPRESPASWGDAGGGRGMHALRAQAVAARSYARSENRYPGFGAQTCDTQACQVYGGAALLPAGQTLAQVIRLEDRRTDQAIAETTGEVRVNGSGAVARTEYSSSTGGYTAGGTFPAVPDAGDAVAANPHKTWTASIETAAITARYPQLGELQAIDIVARNGLGELGGRVTSLVLRGTLASVRLTGNDFRSAFGLKSDWFVISSGSLEGPAAGIAGANGQSYWVVGRNGSVLNANGAVVLGSLTSLRLNAPVVGVAAPSGGRGYWLLGADGGVFAFGLPFYGSTGGMRLNAPVVGMAARPQGDGYWFVATDGGVFSYGAAPFHGSMGGRFLFEPVVGMASTPTGGGYWLVARDGGVFAFGDAPFLGSVGGTRLNQPVVGMAARPQGDGYWFVAADGGVFAFGGARFLGGLGDRRIPSPIVGMAVTASGNGYRLVAADGTVYPFGDAQ